MLTEIVTRALSQLTGRPMSGELIRDSFNTPMPATTANS